MADPVVPQGLLDKIGEWAIVSVLGMIVWVMQKFTGKHIDSMERLTEKLDGIKADVADMKGDIKVLKEHGVRTDARLDTLEDDART